MNDRELEDTLREAKSIADEAAALVLTGYRKPVGIMKKGEIDLLTEFDLKSEELIRKRLAASFPGTSIVGEEGEKDESAEHVWYVDPIDGTTNFAHGHPYFNVSIALCKNLTPLVGVVVAPALQISWTAIRGKGAFRDGQPCKVSPIRSLSQALCATGFSYDRHVTEDDNLREWSAFIKRTVDIRRCGAAALDLAFVADGTYEMYWEQKLKPWDMAAASLFVSESGGRVTDYEGGPLDMWGGRVLATNGLLHDVVLRIMAEARRPFAKT